MEIVREFEISNDGSTSTHHAFVTAVISNSSDVNDRVGVKNTSCIKNVLCIENVSNVSNIVYTPNIDQAVERGLENVSDVRHEDVSNVFYTPNTGIDDVVECGLWRAHQTVKWFESEGLWSPSVHEPCKSLDCDRFQGLQCGFCCLFIFFSIFK